MKLPAAVFRVSRLSGVFSIALFMGLFLPATSLAQLISSGHPVSNPEWEILVTDYGYADLALDRRAGFVGREYLSGEWSAAVHYTGGQNPTNAVWFQPQWFFPDWVSDSNFGVQTNFMSTGTTNASGFTIYRSVITNKDVRVTMTYEMLDSTNGIPQGLTPKSAGGGSSNSLSSRYVFRQTYRITNISGGTLNNFKFYQFLHGLQMTNSIYDDRLYAGAMSEYRYDNTQWGSSYSFNSTNGQIYLHNDTIAFHSKVMPSTYEVGYYGRPPTDDHVVGKPSVGVHWSVETNSLHNTDSFSPPEKKWVSGAQCITNGTLASGASITNDMLLTVRTTSAFAFSGVNIVLRGVSRSGTNMNLDFEETIGGPVVFILLTSTNLALPMAAWEYTGLSYFIDFPQPGWNRFEIPVIKSEPRAFFRIQAIIQN